MSLNIYEELKLYNEYKMIQLEAQKLIQISINKLTGLSAGKSQSDGDERAKKRARVHRRDEALDLSIKHVNNAKSDEQEMRKQKRQSLFSTKSEINLHKSLLINKMLNKSKMVYYEAILKTMRLTILNKLMSYLCLVQNFTKEQHEKLGETLSAPQFRLNLNCENLKLIINEIIDYLISSGNFADTCPLYQAEHFAGEKRQPDGAKGEQSQLNCNLSSAQQVEQEKEEEADKQQQQVKQENDLINEHRFTNPNYLVELLMKMNNCNKCNSCLSQINHLSEINNQGCTNTIDNNSDVIGENEDNNSNSNQFVISSNVNEHANECNRASQELTKLNFVQIHESNSSNINIDNDYNKRKNSIGKPRKSLKRKFSLIQENESNANSNETSTTGNEENGYDENVVCCNSGNGEFTMNFERETSMAHHYGAHSLHQHHHQVRVVV